MASEYYLKSGDQKLGPFSEKQILEGQRSGKVSLFDFIFNKQSNSWVMLMQHPDFCDVESSSSSSTNRDDFEDGESLGKSVTVGLIGQGFRVNTKEEVKNEIISDIARPYWYEKSHPTKTYKFLDVVSLIHKGEFSEQTMLAQNSSGPWKPIIEWSDFSPSSLAQFRDEAENIEVPEIKIRRRHPRFNLGKVFIFAVDGNLFKAFCPDIARLGVSFVVQSHKADIDDLVYVKFSDELTDKNFDAKAVVVGSRKVRMANSNQTYIRYSLRFTQLSESGKRQILAWTSA